MERVRPPKRGGLAIGMERDRRDVLAGMVRTFQVFKTWKVAETWQVGKKRGKAW